MVPVCGVYVDGKCVLWWYRSCACCCAIPWRLLMGELCGGTRLSKACEGEECGRTTLTGGVEEKYDDVVTSKCPADSRGGGDVDTAATLIVSWTVDIGDCHW